MQNHDAIFFLRATSPILRDAAKRSACGEHGYVVGIEHVGQRRRLGHAIDRLGRVKEAMLCQLKMLMI